MILVTGGTGLVGAHLLQQLVAKGEKVRALIRETKTHLSSELADKIEWVEGDVTDILSLEKAMLGVGQVYHCAAIVSFNASERERLMNINVNGTANVVSLALDMGVEKLVHVSSIAALGKINNGDLINENTAWNSEHTNSQYAVSKYLSEQEVWRGIAEGLNAVIINPSLILGVGEWGRGSLTIFSMARKGMRFYTKGSTGMVSANDVARAMVVLMESNISAERYIVSAENWTYKKLFDCIADNLNKKRPNIAITNSMIEVIWRMAWLIRKTTGLMKNISKDGLRSSNLNRAYDNSKLIGAFGFEYSSLEKSIKEICEKL